MGEGGGGGGGKYFCPVPTPVSVLWFDCLRIVLWPTNALTAICDLTSIYIHATKQFSSQNSDGFQTAGYRSVDVS